MRRISRPRCPSCGAEGTLCLEHLTDRLSSMPGTWGFRRCETPSCGLLWLDPSPHPADIHLAYRDYFTVARPHGAPLVGFRGTVARGFLASCLGYDEQVGIRSRMAGALAWLHPGERQEIQSSVMYLPRDTRGRLVEIGFGSGTRLAVFRALGWTVTGVESDQAALDHVSSWLGVPLFRWSGGDLPFEDAAVDAVVMSHTLEHVADPLGLLREARRILAPGGRLVVVTPNLRSLLSRVFGRSWVHLDPPRHRVLFTSTSLMRVVEEAGFAVVRRWASTRNLASTLYSSLRIHHTGRFEWRRKPRLGVRPWAVAVHWAGWLASFPWPDLGDELVVVARPSGN